MSPWNQTGQTGVTHQTYRVTDENMEASMCQVNVAGLLLKLISPDADLGSDSVRVTEQQRGGDRSEAPDKACR